MQRWPADVLQLCFDFSGDEGLALTCRAMLELFDCAPYAKRALWLPKDQEPASGDWAQLAIDSFERKGSLKQLLHASVRVEGFVLCRAPHFPVVFAAHVARLFAGRKLVGFSEDEQKAFVRGCVLSRQSFGRARLSAAIEAAFSSKSLVVGACVALAAGSLAAVATLSRKPDFNWLRFMLILTHSFAPWVSADLRIYFYNHSASLTHHGKRCLATAALRVFPGQAAVGWMHVDEPRDAAHALNMCWVLQPAAGVALLQMSLVCRQTLESDPRSFLAACVTIHALMPAVWRLQILSKSLQERLEVGMFTAALQNCAKDFPSAVLSKWANERPHELLEWTHACMFRNVREADVAACWALLRLRALPFFTHFTVSEAITRHWWVLRAELQKHIEYQAAAVRERTMLVRNQ